MRSAGDIRDELAACDRARPHLRDLGDLDNLDARQAALRAELADLEVAA